MKKPFKFRYVYELTGIFVLVSLCILIIMIFVSGKLQGWFESKIKYSTVFTTKDGTFGLQKGGEVRVFDTLAGKVISIIPKKSGIVATFEINKLYHKFISIDSKAAVKKKFGLAGDAYLELIPGDPEKAILKNGSIIESIRDTEVTETIQQVMEDVRQSFLPAIQKFNDFLDKLDQTTTQINTTFVEAETFIKDFKNSSLPAVDNIKTFIDDLLKVANKLDKTINELNTLINGINSNSVQGMTKFRNAMQDIKVISDRLREMVENINKNDLNEFIAILPYIGTRLEETLYEAEKVLEGAQKHWLIRKYVDKSKNEEVMMPLPSIEKE